MKAIVVAGARPNFIKIAPIVNELEVRKHEVLLLHSGQHYDARMSDVFFDELGIRAPDVNLEVGPSSPTSQTASVMTGFEPVLREFDPDVVIVVGDVTSTLACALVTAHAGVRLAHVEAGLRSRDWAMPEEINRVVTDRLSDHLLAPSLDGVENLRREGYRDDQISLVGNVMIDTLLANRERAARRPILDELGLGSRPYVLATLHRPSNVDDPASLEGLLGALIDISATFDIVFPAHPRVAHRLEPLAKHSSIRVIEPVGYLDSICLQQSSSVVITDSGGMQEETTVLGIPCLTVRENTERPITILEGTNTLVGTDPSRLLEAFRSVIDNPPPPRAPQLWDGRAGSRIVDVLEAGNGWGPDRRPTALAHG